MIELSWGAVSGATGYRLRRKIASDPDTSLVLIYDGTDLEYTDYPLRHDYSQSSTPTVSWTYVLVAYNGDGEGSEDFDTHAMTVITVANVTSIELSHPSYNDGSDKTASYADISKSGSGGASDDELNSAMIFHATQNFQAI